MAIIGFISSTNVWCSLFFWLYVVFKIKWETDSYKVLNHSFSFTVALWIGSNESKRFVHNVQTYTHTHTHTHTEKIVLSAKTNSMWIFTGCVQKGMYTQIHKWRWSPF